MRDLLLKVQEVSAEICEHRKWRKIDDGSDKHRVVRVKSVKHRHNNDIIGDMLINSG